MAGEKIAAPDLEDAFEEALNELVSTRVDSVSSFGTAEMQARRDMYLDELKIAEKELRALVPFEVFDKYESALAGMTRAELEAVYLQGLKDGPRLVDFFTEGHRVLPQDSQILAKGA